jgi:SAM-dependent methyltransferase
VALAYRAAVGAGRDVRAVGAYDAVGAASRISPPTEGPMAERRGHPVLAAVIDVAMAPLARLRPRVVGAASGRVLEVGSGTGLNFALYGGAVDEVVALEPDPHMMRRARARAAGASVPIRLVDGGIEDLPADIGLFDTVVLTFVLCTIPDAAGALARVAEVLAPGGRVLWVEHHAASCGHGRWAQGALEPAWKWAAGGCHLTREPVALLQAAGFIVEPVEPCGGQCALTPVSRGVARRG